MLPSWTAALSQLSLTSIVTLYITFTATTRALGEGEDGGGRVRACEEREEREGKGDEEGGGGAW